jgi:hypothetical protein
MMIRYIVAAAVIIILILVGGTRIKSCAEKVPEAIPTTQINEKEPPSALILLTNSGARGKASQGVWLWT